MNECDIFVSALEFDSPEERAAFLDKTCGNDTGLRKRLETLLDSHAKSGSLLEHPAIELAATQLLDDTAKLENRHPTDEGTATYLDHPPLDFLESSDEPDSLGRLGQYEMRQVIGRGGMGIVLQASDTKLNRVVAVKVLAPELAANATARKRFLREAQAAAAVSHDHVVTVYAVEENELPKNAPRNGNARLPYLVMEFIEGRSLQERIDADGPLELKEILRIGRQIAAGLGAAHEQGLIHRDVKPSNILLQNGVERVQITDFGLARAVDDVGMTRTGEVAGTPQYMSPEQAQGIAVETRSDLFSLGSVLYAMCTGRSPFRAETTVATLRRVCDDMPRPIQEVNSDIPAWLVEIIDKLLEKEPADRFQTAAEVGDLLGKHLAHLQNPNTTLMPEKVIRATPATARNDSRRHRWVIAGSLLLLALIGLSITEATGVTQISATVIRIATGEGTLVIEVDDPSVQVSLDGEELSITGAGIQELKLRPGQYQFRATKDGRSLKQELVTITRGGRQVLRITRESALSKLSAQSDFESDRLIAKLEGHTGPVDSVRFSPDGLFAASGSGWPNGDGTVRIWEIPSGRLLKTCQCSSSVMQVRISSDGRYVLAAQYDGKATMWEVTTGRKLHEWLHAPHVQAVAFSKDGKRAYTAAHDLRVWDVTTGKLIEVMDVPHRKSFAKIHFLEFADSESRVFVSLLGGAGENRFSDVLLWDFATGETELISSNKEISGRYTEQQYLSTFPGSNVLLILPRSGAVRVYDVQRREFIRELSVDVSAGMVTPNGHFLLRHPYSTDTKGYLDVYEIATLKIVNRIATPQKRVLSIAVSPDGRSAITAGGRMDVGDKSDFSMHLWRLPESVWPIESQIEKASKSVDENPDDADAWFARAQLYLRQEQWEKACDDFRQAVQFAPENDLALLAYGAATIKVGKFEEYRRFCRTLLEQFEDTTDPTIADKITKICLLYPDAFNVSELPVETIDRLTQNEGDGFRVNFCVTRALISYRSGDMDDCIRWLREVESTNELTLHLRVRWLLIQAMAQNRQGNEEKALEALEEARQFFERYTPFAVSTSSQWWTAGWLAAEVLRIEAENLLNVPSEKVSSESNEPATDRKTEQRASNPVQLLLPKD